MELDVNIFGTDIVSEMVLMLYFGILIFMVKDRLCSINYSKKILYIILFKSYLKLQCTLPSMGLPLVADKWKNSVAVICFYAIPNRVNIARFITFLISV